MIMTFDTNIILICLKLYLSINIQNIKHNMLSTNFYNNVKLFVLSINKMMTYFIYDYVI